MPARGGIIWRTSPSDLGKKIKILGDEIDEKVLRVAQVIAEEVQQYMVSNHRWVNRSYEAEDNLRGEAVRLAEHLIAIYAVSGAPHGVFLEMEGSSPDPKWGIIPEALQQAYPRVMQELAGLLGSRG